MTSNYIQEIKQFIEEAQAVLITAGAGMGVDSGLPDFRGDEGFWRAYPAIKELQISLWHGLFTGTDSTSTKILFPITVLQCFWIWYERKTMTTLS